MVRLPRLTVFLVASVGWFVATSELLAQGKQNFEKVRITTVDGVDLAGYFYPSAKKKATVLMLHALGEDSKKKYWTALAEQLQAEGYVVLTFDFRGHGNSTVISDDKAFWNIANKGAFQKNKAKDSIEFKNMQTNAYPLFCNDVAAARAWLDRKNDSGACNVSNLIVIGAESGATVGALWLNSEWRRQKISTVQMGMLTRTVVNPRPEGKDVIAAIWLSMTPKLGTRTIPVGPLLKTPALVKATPMVFMHGDTDKEGKDFARSRVKEIKADKKDKDKYANTDAVAIPNTNLKGQGLLIKSLKADESIISYLNTILEERSQEPFDREFRKTDFIWALGGPNGTPAKSTQGLDPANLNFDTYERFILNPWP